MTKYCIRTLECYTHSMYYSTQYIHSSEIRNVRLCEVLSIVRRIASNCRRKLKTDQSTLSFRMYKIWQILTINLISLPEFVMSAAYVLSVTTVFNEISPQLIRKFVRALFFFMNFKLVHQRRMGEEKDIRFLYYNENLKKYQLCMFLRFSLYMV